MLNVATLVARVVADTSGFNRGMGEAESRLAETGAAMQRTGRALTMSLTVPLLVVAGAAVKFSIDFQKQMELIHTQAGASQRQVDQMTQSVLGLAPATAFGPVKLAEALYHIESVGDRGAAAMKVLKAAAEGAAVGQSNLEDTASALVGTLRVFHEPASKAVEVMGQLNAIVGAGNMRMNDLVGAISTGLLPVSKGLGIGLNAVGAALATMTDESVPAQVAATRMRTLLLLMTGETKKNVDTLNQLGIKQGELGAKMRQPGGMIPALQDLEDHLKKLPATDQVRILAEAFGGSRSAGTIIQLLNNLGMVSTKFEQINHTAGNFPKDVLATQATDAFKLKEAWAAIQTVLVQVGGILAPFVVEIATAISKAALAFGQLSPHIKDLVVYGTMVVAALGPVIWIIGTLMTTVEALGAVLAAILSPEILIVAAVAALVIGFIDLYRHSQEVQDAVQSLLDTLRKDGLDVFNAVKGVIEALANTLHGIFPTWKQFGDAVTQALGVIKNIVNTVVTFVVGLFNQMAAGIKAHSTEIRAFVQTTWSAIEAIFKAVMPIITAVVKVAWDAIKIVITTAMKVIGDIILVVMDLISGNWKGAWNAIKNATETLLSGILHLIETLLSGLIPIVLKIAEAIGKAIWDGIKGVTIFIVTLPGVLIGLLAHAIAEVASWALNAALGIGSAIIHGIEHGVTSLAGNVLSTLKNSVMGPIHGLMGALGIGSPSKYTSDNVGKPIADGIIQGYLLGIGTLPAKMTASVRTAIEAARTAISSVQQTVADAWTRLSDYAFKAYDARTTQHLNAMQTKFDALIKSKITDPLNKAMAALDAAHQGSLDAITGVQNQLTPSEAALQQLQDQHAEQQRQDAIATAQAALATAQGGTDPSAVEQAQKDLANALYDEQIANLQKSATAERTAAGLAAAASTKVENDAYAAKQLALQAQFDLLQANMTKVYNQQVLNYQAQRDLQKQHLTDLLTQMGVQLQQHPELWKKDHAKIMKLFKEDFGPDYEQAGKNLGLAFATGIREATAAAGESAKALAAEVAKYLKLGSPTEKGPMSDLHKWWRPMASTLAQGIDHSALASITKGLVPPAGGGVGTNTPAGFDPKSLADALKAALGNSAPLIGEYHDHTGAGAESVATTLGRKLAMR